MPDWNTPDDKLWSRTQELFLASLELPDKDRGLFLDRACDSDTKLRAEVESLLEYDQGGADLASSFHSAAASIVDDDVIVGQRAGAYQIIEELGRGGMGTVYRAVRADDEYRKQVAIKVVKRGMDTDATLERFRQERQILANLDHPYIARLLDGGSIGGQPFFVMELIEGISIDQYCREQSLSPAAVCRLFLRVCEGVEHAHHNLIVHRDLKPSNILVTADGTPKLLDFGVAKLLRADQPDSPVVTQFAQRQMTPEYASPEQFKGLPATTATDVYALSAVLYELLTGVRAHQLSASQPENWEANICTEQVKRPTASNPKFPRDLETIVLMGLHKEPERRYPSVEQFAADIRRYLEKRPVEARADTFQYRARKYLRRNWLAALSAAAILVALVGGIVVSSLEARRANRERDRADMEAATATATVDFLRNDLLAQADPVAQKGPGLTVGAALDRAAEKIPGKFSGRPAVEAAIRTTLGETYFALTRYPEAQQQFQYAANLYGAQNGPRSAPAVASMTSVAASLRAQGKLAEAERLYLEILPGQPLAVQTRDPETLVTMGNLAVVYASQQKYAQAEALNVKVLAAQRSVIGVEHLDTLRTMNNLGVNYTKQGKFDLAEELYRQVLDIRRRKQGADHPTTLFTMTNLAAVYVARKTNSAEAERLLKEALHGQQQTLGAEHRETLFTMNNLAALWLSQGKYDAAAEMFSKTATLRRHVFGPLHPDTLSSATSYGESLLRQSKYHEAEACLREVVSDFEKSGSDIWVRDAALTMFGASMAGQKRYRDAEAALLAGRQGLINKQTAIPVAGMYFVQQSATWIADLYEDWGEPKLAAEWRLQSVADRH